MKEETKMENDEFETCSSEYDDPDLVEEPKNTNQNMNENICKYCLDEITDKKTLAFKPCLCNYQIHPKCLEKWLLNSNRLRCEICNTVYAVEYVSVIGIPWKLKEWFKYYRYHILLFLLFILVPFFGQNDSSLTTYQISNDELTCINDYNDKSTFSQYVYGLIILSPIGVMLDLLMTYPPLMMIFIPLYRINKDNIDTSLLQKKWVIFAGSLILVSHVIFYVIGNLLYNYYVLPIQFADSSYSQYPECSQFNQIQIDRYDHFRGINISLVTWFLGSSIACTSLLFFAASIYSVVLLGMIFFGVVYCFRAIFKFIYKVLKDGFCTICCSCFVQQRIIINDLSV